MSTTTVKRTLTVAPDIIVHLINEQAGSLGKAILECVQNSVDAGATRVDVVVDENKLSVQDDGKGFTTIEEIQQYFDVFGFSHEGLQKSFGKFGIGRGQLMSFAATQWRTNGFEMHVDIRKSGLDYDLVTNAPLMKGLRIEAALYEPLRSVELLSFERELEELCVYAMLPVYLNGKRISKDPREEKWTHETDDAWIRTSTVLRSMTVYNQGVRVRDYPAYKFGIGGIVVTKPGVPLALNMARNDILDSTCKVWKRLQPFLRQKAVEEIRRSPRLNEDQLAQIAGELVAGEKSWSDVSDVKLVSDVGGRRMDLRTFLQRAQRTLDQTVCAVSSSEVNSVCERSHAEGHCFVLSEATLTRFGVASVSAFLDTLAKIQARQIPPLRWSSGIKAVDDWRDACHRVSEHFAEHPKKSWSKFEHAAVDGITKAARAVMSAVVDSGETIGGMLLQRQIRIGISSSADAWTDGQKVIWINREALSMIRDGISGMTCLAALLLHEYLHEEPTSGSHAHDTEFYERFERVMHFRGRRRQGGSSGNISTVGCGVHAGLRAYLYSATRRGVRPGKVGLRELDEAEQAAPHATPDLAVGVDECEFEEV